MATTEISLSLRPVAPTLGAEISGLDVRTLDADGFAAVQRAFATHRLLVFKQQSLSPAELMAFGERWGELHVHPITPHLDGFPPVQAIQNAGKRTTLNEHWHTDMSFEPVPPKVTMLHALQIPGLGGDTAFADQHAAYESLSDGLKALLDGVRAVHGSDDFARLLGKDPKTAPRGVHPVFRTHPDTGRKALYVCRAFTQRFENMTRAESAGLLEFLFERSVRPDFTHRHRWEVGDLVMWDNRSLLHYAIHDHGDEPRLLHRVTVLGEVPA
ncbi:MAG TPA: TauD/TfdA family dioxygenase [Acidimicrobiales bacterium]|nr:TauD/TfdA family dioxygenase [Acidimicrobiales bacterium]